MTRKTLIAGTYVTAAGLLLAMGAAAHYFKGGPGHPAASQSGSKTGQGMMSGQMGQGMMAQKRDMTETREKMRHLVDELMVNHRAMEKARSIRRIKPLLKKNGEMLDRLSDEMARSWGMHGEMNRAMGSHMASSGKSRSSRTTTKSSRSSAGSAAHSRLVAEGKEIFRVDGCRVCHGSTGKGTAAGPSLIGVGKKYSAEKLAHLIRHPATARMPSFPESALPEAKLKAVIAFLQTLH